MKFRIIALLLLFLLSATVHAQERQINCAADDWVDGVGNGDCVKWVSGPEDVAQASISVLNDPSDARRVANVLSYGQVKYYSIPFGGLQARYKCQGSDDRTTLTYGGLNETVLDGTIDVSTTTPERNPSRDEFVCTVIATYGATNYVQPAKLYEKIFTDYYVLNCAADSDCFTIPGRACDNSYRDPGNELLSPLQWHCVDNGTPSFVTPFVEYPAVANIGESYDITAYYTDTPALDPVWVIVNDCDTVHCMEFPYCESEYSVTSPVSCPFTPQDGEQGIKTLYVFVCDDQDECSEYQEISIRINYVPDVSLIASEETTVWPNWDTTFTPTFSDIDGTIANVSLDFGDGGPPEIGFNSDEEIYHAYPPNTTETAIPYDAILSVTDNDGETSTFTLPITASPEGNLLPVPVLSVAPAEITREGIVTSTYNCTDPDDPDQHFDEGIDDCWMNYGYWDNMPDEDGDILNGISGSFPYTYMNYTNVHATRTNILRAYDRADVMVEVTETINVLSEPRLRIVTDTTPYRSEDIWGNTWTDGLGIEHEIPTFIAGTTVHFMVEAINGDLSNYTNFDWDWARHDINPNPLTGFFGVEGNPECYFSVDDGASSMDIYCTGTWYKRITLRALDTTNNQETQTSFIFYSDTGPGQHPLTQFIPYIQQIKSGFNGPNYDASCQRWMGVVPLSLNYDPGEMLFECEIHWRQGPNHQLTIVNNPPTYESFAEATLLTGPESPYTNYGDRISLERPYIDADNFSGHGSSHGISLNILPQNNLLPRANILSTVSSALLMEDVEIIGQCSDYDGAGNDFDAQGNMFLLPPEFCQIDFREGDGSENMDLVIEDLGLAEWIIESPCSDTYTITGERIEFNASNNCLRSRTGSAAAASGILTTKLVKDVSHIGDNDFDISVEIIPSIDNILNHNWFQYYQGIILEDNDRRFISLDAFLYTLSAYDDTYRRDTYHEMVYYNLYENITYPREGQVNSERIIPYPNNRGTYFKLSRRGTVLAAYYSDDGSNYKILGSRDLRDLDDALGNPFQINRAGIFFGNSSPAGGFTASFDNFEFNVYRYSKIHQFSSVGSFDILLSANDGTDIATDTLTIDIGLENNTPPVPEIIEPAGLDAIAAFNTESDTEITISGTATDSGANEGIARIYWETPVMPAAVCDLITDAPTNPDCILDGDAINCSNSQTDVQINSTIICTYADGDPDFREFNVILYATDERGGTIASAPARIRLGLVSEENVVRIMPNGITPANPNQVSSTVTFEFFCPLGDCIVTGVCLAACDEPGNFTETIGQGNRIISKDFDSINGFDFQITISGEQLNTDGSVSNENDSETIHYSASSSEGGGSSYPNDILEISSARLGENAYSLDDDLELTIYVRNYSITTYEQTYSVELKDMVTGRIAWSNIYDAYEFLAASETAVPVTIDLNDETNGVEKGNYRIIIVVTPVTDAGNTEYSANNKYSKLSVAILEPQRAMSVPEIPPIFILLVLVSVLFVINRFKNKG
ncbi:MAG: hypothetical protein ABID38_03545 [Candidatus Diapherotrites archaeon]